MTDPWDERTEAIPGVKADGSIDLDLGPAPGDPNPAPSPMAFLDAPTVLVFEPTSIGVAAAFEALGFAVRVGVTAVDVMDTVARAPPSLVVCAPVPEPERRRMLAAALRIRFPHVPIIYVSRHAAQEEAVLGAIREGARAVVAWPLPPAADVKRVLGPYLVAGPGAASRSSGKDVAELDTAPVKRVGPLPVVVQAGHAIGVAPTERDTTPHGRSALTPGGSEEASFDEIATAVVPQLLPSAPERPATATPPPRTAPESWVQELPSDAMRPLPVVVPLPDPQQSMISAAPTQRKPAPPATTSGMLAQPDTEPPTARVRRGTVAGSGEIGELLDALSPFWWSLDDAVRYLQERSERGDLDARTHARTMRAVLQILEQVRRRVNESGA